MSFLKKLGQIVSTASELVPVYGPIVAALIPGAKDDAVVKTIATDLDAAMSVVAQVEIMGQALQIPGNDKAKAAAPAIFQIMLSTKLVAGKKLKDPVAAKAAAERLGGDLADFLNAFEG